MLATATEGQQTAVKLLGIDYDVQEIRVFLRDSDDNVTQEATDTTAYVEGDDVTLHFTAPAADTYDLAIKADLDSSGDTRTLFQDSNAIRITPDFGS